jgi:hypothetical protein
MISMWGFEYKGLRDAMHCWIFCLTSPTHVAQEGKHHNANKLPIIIHNGRVTKLSYLNKCTRGGKDVLTFYHIHMPHKFWDISNLSKLA